MARDTKNLEAHVRTSIRARTIRLCKSARFWLGVSLPRATIGRGSGRNKAVKFL